MRLAEKFCLKKNSKQFFPLYFIEVFWNDPFSSPKGDLVDFFGPGEQMRLDDCGKVLLFFWHCPTFFRKKSWIFKVYLLFFSKACKKVLPTSGISNGLFETQSFLGKKFIFIFFDLPSYGKRIFGVLWVSFGYT